MRDNRGLASADEETREEVSHKGGEAVSRDREHMSEIGQKGGRASQESGNAHKLTEKDRRKGGEHSSGQR